MKKTETPTNPYLAARLEWNERYGSYIAAAHTWKLVAFISMIITAIAVGGVVYIGSQSKLVPYVVEVDKLGNAVANHIADKARPTDVRIIKAMLARFVTNIRSVLVDATAQKKAILEAYAMLSNADAATSTLNEYFQKDDNSPFERAKKEMVSVEVSSILPVSDKTWEIEWIETVRNRKGQHQYDVRMKGMLTIIITPPTTQDNILNNPVGLYIKEFSWSKQL